MNSNPLVSVIIPTFNRSSVIQRSVQSVLSQSYSNLELIIVDDGSTDDTLNLLSSFEEDKRVRVFSQNNHGVSQARNFAIKKAKGEYISFLDSDDEWLINKLEKQIDFILANPEYLWCHTEEIWIRNGIRVNPKKKHSKGGGNQFIPSLSMCMISPSTVLIHKSIFKKFGMFREDYPVCEDYDLWLKISSQLEIGFIETAQIKKYGGHDDQLSRKYFAMDYYRIKSIHSLLTNEKLTSEVYESAKNILLKKSKILLKGYIKHNNLKDYDEVKNIQKLYL